jgi:hypothetical protein
VPAADVLVSRIPFTLAFLFFHLNEEENRKNIAASPEGSTSGEDSSNSGEGVPAEAAAAAVAVMRAATMVNLPSMRTILRRWMSQIRCYVRTLHIFKAACTFV